ncbi:MAG: Crp/Fnr family transcriptional regulator [Bacteroidota bacterium]
MKTNPLKRLHVKKGEFLQRGGELNTKVYRVHSGLLRSFCVDEKGREHIFMFAPEGWIIADSTPPDVPSSLYIEALEDSLVVVSEKRLDVKTIDFKRIVRRMEALQYRVIMLMSSSALERYEDFVKTYPDIVQRVSQKMIASYLGITPQALSKVKRELYERRSKGL